MAQLHKLAAVGLTLTLSSMSSAFALGLGEVTWKSNLNQPLDAEIAVYDARNVSNRELVVKIASDEEFAKAGINKPFILSNLIFTPMIKSNGKGIIKITSRGPIKEPYLDFLIHVTWATGQTLREYTLLIDPPAYDTSSVAAPVSARPVAKTNTVKKNTRPVAKAPSRAPAPARAKVQEGTVKAYRGSSLWLLAERSRVRGVSVQQAMLAIYEANPDAFIDGKMSLLKEGAVLRIPKVDEMRKTSSLAAQEQVLANVNGTVQTKPRQVIASQTEQQAASNKDIKDELKLSGVSDKSNSSTTTATASLENSLTQTAEELDATRRNNEDLKDRVKSLESSLADMKKMVELKNTQLAALQQNIKGQLAASEEEQKAAPTDSLSNEPAVEADLLQAQQPLASTEKQPIQNEAKVISATPTQSAQSEPEVSVNPAEQRADTQTEVKQGTVAN